jgi:2-polyprenyl-6-methoxyphenol hydroxylase-like FAD-dependent oxidoreductase
MPELARWSRGRVLLMGDAAHAVSPHSGQGASMAIEDAVVLAALLDDAETIEAAFARFFALRQERSQAAIRVGRAAGGQKSAQGWLQLRLRDLILPLVMPMAAKAQSRLFAFRADRFPLTQPVQ